MRKYVLKETEEIVDKIIEREDDTLLIGYYETIIEALNLLIKKTDFDIVCAEICPYDYDNYDGAYFLNCDDRGDIYVGKAFDEEIEKFYFFDCDHVYIEEDFCADYAEINGDTNVDVFTFSDDIEMHTSGQEPLLTIDNDRCGFCLCYTDDNNTYRFKYRGQVRLTNDMIVKIINDNFS